MKTAQSAFFSQALAIQNKSHKILSLINDKQGS